MMKSYSYRSLSFHGSVTSRLERFFTLSCRPRIIFIGRSWTLIWLLSPYGTPIAFRLSAKLAPNPALQGTL